MKKIILLSFLLFCQNWLFAQNYDSLLRTYNYASDLIQANYDWEAILDSVQSNFPRNKQWITHLEQSVIFLNSPIGLNPVDTLMKQLLTLSNRKDYEALKAKIEGLELQGIGQLIQYLNNHSATRIVHTNLGDLYDRKTYLCVSDFAIHSIEKISGIYFFKDFVHSERLFSRDLEPQQTNILQKIIDWYDVAKNLNKAEGISLYLEEFAFGSAGNKMYTARNLAEAGDTSNAIRYLTNLYTESKRYGILNMNIANLVKKLGGEIAMEDCLNRVYNFRSIPNPEYVWYIIKYAGSHITFKVLADVVKLERFSLYKKGNEKFNWHYIFAEMADINNPDASIILLEFLKISDVVNGSNLVSYTWEKVYPQQYNNHFRVCDFALLKLFELRPELKRDVDWSDKASINSIIIQVLNFKK